MDLRGNNTLSHKRENFLTTKALGRKVNGLGSNEPPVLGCSADVGLSLVIQSMQAQSEGIN